MGKNIRRGKKSNVRCSSCGQLTRRDRSVYLFRDGIKTYYCPDCAKKVHGSRLYKGIPTFTRRPSRPKVRRKFAIFSRTNDEGEESVPTPVDAAGPVVETPTEEEKREEGQK